MSANVRPKSGAATFRILAAGVAALAIAGAVRAEEALPPVVSNADTAVSAPVAMAPSPLPAVQPSPSVEGAPSAPPVTPSPVLPVANQDPAPSPAVQPAVADAKPATPDIGGCFRPPMKVADEQVDAFLKNPAALFGDTSTKSADVSFRVRGLAGSDLRAVAAIADFARTANAAQRASIGSGLGRAAFTCSKVNPAFAAEIQSKVADLALPELTLAFVTATNDMQVAFIGASGGGGGGGAAAGLSGGGIAGPGSAGMSGDDVVPTTVETYRNNGSGIRVDVGSGDSNRRSVGCVSCSLIN